MLVEMVDPRIMVAVLASMLLTATGLETGVNPGEITDGLPDGIGVGGLLETQSDSNSTAAYQVTARFSLNDTQPQNLSLEEARLDVGSSEVTLSSGKLASNQSIAFVNFSGRISTSRPVEASGDVAGWSTGATRFDGAERIEGSIGSSGFSAVATEQDQLTFSGVSGVMEVDDTRTRFEDERDTAVRGFSGRITFNSEKDMLELNGSASGVQAGSLSYD